MNNVLICLLASVDLRKTMFAFHFINQLWEPRRRDITKLWIAFAQIRLRFLPKLLWY